MLNNTSNSLTYYPAYCFSISPTFSTWAKLTAADVHALQEREGFEGQKIYFHLNHPIKWVRLVGVIVAFEVTDYRWMFQLDDSSGTTIEITCPRERLPSKGPRPYPTNAPTKGEIDTNNYYLGRTVSGNAVDMKGLDLGCVVKVKGGIGEFRDERQITLERISIIHTTTEEAVAWSELHQFRSQVLSRPWTVPPTEEQGMKEEADGSRRRAEEKQRRKAEREMKEMKRRKRAEARAVTAATKSKRRTSDKENHVD